MVVFIHISEIVKILKLLHITTYIQSIYLLYGKRSERTSRSYNMRESVIYLKWLNNLNYLYAWKSMGWFYR